MTKDQLSKDNKSISGDPVFSEFDDILLNAPIGIFSYTPDGRILSANPSMARILGYGSPQELIKSVVDIGQHLYADASDREKAMGLLDMQGEFSNYECRALRGDGSTTRISLTVKAIKSKNGDINQYHGFISDVSQGKQEKDGLYPPELKYQEDMERHKTLLQTIADNIFDLVALADLDGNFEFVGKSHEILGYAPESLVGINVMDLVHPEDLPAVVHDFKIFSKLQDDGRRVEYRCQCKDGSYLWFETIGRFIRDDDHNPKKILFSTRDITEHKLAGNALRKSESLFRKVFEILPVGLWIADKSGKLMKGNPAGVAIWGQEPKVDQQEYGVFKARRLPSGEEIAPDDWALAHTINKGETIVDELLEIETFDGKKKVILNYTGPVLDQNGNVEAAIVVNQDITARYQAEEALRESEKRFRSLHSEIRQVNNQLEKANTDKDRLFSIIAHDLKSPMAGVFGSSKLLATERGSLSQEEIKFISKEIHKGMQNLLTLLDDLMQWARMNTEGVDYHPEQYSLYELARHSLKTAEDVAERKNIHIQSDIPEELKIFADKSMINTVIRNLIFNAVKFTRQGGNISITARKNDSCIEVCVKDDGIGMNESIRSAVFSLDKSKRQVGTGGEKGTGLGLVLCKEFVEKHGGRIRVESEPGKGTEVCFTLPAVQVDQV